VTPKVTQATQERPLQPSFPDGHSALMLCAARLRHIAGTQWGTKRYLNIDLLKEQELEQRHSLAEAI
jgi:putative transposase